MTRSFFLWKSAMSPNFVRKKCCKLWNKNFHSWKVSDGRLDLNWFGLHARTAGLQLPLNPNKCYVWTTKSTGKVIQLCTNTKAIWFCDDVTDHVVPTFCSAVEMDIMASVVLFIFAQSNHWLQSILSSTLRKPSSVLYAVNSAVLVPDSSTLHMNWICFKLRSRPWLTFKLQRVQKAKFHSIIVASNKMACRCAHKTKFL